jgi:glycosyltransferase involved in cell wall biosynthesis
LIDVSIIIPIFNRLWALPKAVDSCLSPGCRTGVIVADDGSTEGAWEWLRDRKDVVSLRQENWGKDRAVVAGMAAPQGEYARVLDSHAAVAYVWPVVRGLAKTQPDEAAKAAGWALAVDPAFVPPVRSSIRLAYRLLGFRRTERLIGLWARVHRPLSCRSTG